MSEVLEYYYIIVKINVSFYYWLIEVVVLNEKLVVLFLNIGVVFVIRVKVKKLLVG